MIPQKKSTIYPKKKKKKKKKKIIFYIFFVISSFAFYLFKFNWVVLAAENREIHHRSKPILKFAPVLLFFSHYLAYMSNAFQNIGLELVIRSCNRNGIL